MDALSISTDGTVFDDAVALSTYGHILFIELGDEPVDDEVVITVDDGGGGGAGYFQGDEDRRKVRLVVRYLGERYEYEVEKGDVAAHALAVYARPGEATPKVLVNGIEEVPSVRVRVTSDDETRVVVSDVKDGGGPRVSVRID